MTNDTDTPTGTDVVVLENDLARVEAILRGQAQAPESIADPAEVSAEIVDRLLSQTGADVLTAGKALHARDLVGLPIMLHRVRWARSRFDEGGPGVFALLEGVAGAGGRKDQPAEGEQIVVTCGGVFVMAALLVLVRDELLPIAVQITTTESASGRNPLRLEPA